MPSSMRSGSSSQSSLEKTRAGFGAPKTFWGRGRFGLGTLALVLVASSILAAPSGAEKPADTITCTARTTTLTWVAGTTRIDYEWRDASNNLLGEGTGPRRHSTRSSAHLERRQLEVDPKPLNDLLVP
jgi:hypothetical protein